MWPSITANGSQLEIAFLDLLNIDGNGRLSEWPEGFFDETERSLDRLLGGN